MSATLINQNKPRQHSIFKRSFDDTNQQDYINEEDNIEDPILKIDLQDEDDLNVDDFEFGNNQDTTEDQNTKDKMLDTKQKLQSQKKKHRQEHKQLPEQHMCDCSICEAQNKKLADSDNEIVGYDDSSINDHFGILEEKKVKYRQDFPYENEDKPLEKDYAYIITRLQPVKKGNRALRLFVPETIIFLQGEAKLLIHTHKDKMLRFIKQKEKLNLQELRKFMNKKRYKYRYLVENMDQRQQQQNQGNIRNDISIYSQDVGKKRKNLGSANNSNQNITNLNSAATAQQNREDMIKEKDNREAVLIKYNIEVEQKKNNEGHYVNILSQNQLGQGVQSTTGNNAGSQQNNQLNSNLQNNLQLNYKSISSEKMQKQTSGIQKQNAIISLQQNQQSYPQFQSIITYQQFNQVLNELEFLNLMMKRKIDPIWSTVLFIQNYLKLKKRNMEYIKVKFRYEEDQWHPLFNRALNEIQIINGEISQASQDYIPPEQEQEFEDRLMKNNIDSYVRYMCFKIFHYVEVFHNSKITRMRTEWMQDDFGCVYFMNAYKVKHQPRTKSTLSSEMYMKKLELVAEKKLSSNTTLENHYLNIQKKQIFEIFADMLFKEHEKSNKQLHKDNVKKQLKENLNRIYQGRKQEGDYQIPHNIANGFVSTMKSPTPIQELKKFIFNQNPNNLKNKALKPIQKQPNSGKGDGLTIQTSSTNLNKPKSDKSLLRTQTSSNSHRMNTFKSPHFQSTANEAIQDMNFKIPSQQESKNMPLTLTYKVKKEQSTLNRVRIQNKVFDQLYKSPIFSKSRFVQNYPRIDYADQNKKTLPSFLYAQEIQKFGKSADGKFHLKNFHILQQ